MPDPVTVRLAVPADIPAMQRIEVAAGRLFAEIGMQDVADDDARETCVLEGYVSDGRAWIAEAGERACGFALVDVVDGSAHLEEVSVDPEWGRQGIGRRIIEAVAGWASDEGFPAMTLLTFRIVPWNGPYYARLGFRELPDDRLGPELAALRRHEAERGLDADARWAMALPLG